MPPSRRWKRLLLQPVCPEGREEEEGSAFGAFLLNSVLCCRSVCKGYGRAGNCNPSGRNTEASPPWRMTSRTMEDDM